MTRQLEHYDKTTDPDSWQLVQLNEFDEACKKADIEFMETKSIPSLRHKWFALANLRKYEDAQRLANQIIELNNGNTDFDFILAGITLWILNNKPEAINQWQKGEKAIYTDAAGGLESQLILYFAAIKINDGGLKDKSTRKISKIIRSKRAVNWPGPMGNYILNNLTATELNSFILKVPFLKERQGCQADFVKAVKELEKGDTAMYKQFLTNATSYGPNAYLEPMYYLAQGELSQCAD